MYTMRHKFGIFITCYKDTEITTLTTMKNIGYKGPIRLIVGTDDPKLEEFKKLYGDLVYVFDKKDIEKRYKVDLMLSNSDKIYNIIIFAKFACYECAKEMGLDYWQQLDDDYTGWSIRHVEFEPNTKKEELKTYPFRDADTGKEQVYEQVVDLMIDVLDSNPKFCCIAFAQAGDFIGGASSFYRIHGKRKVMNTIIT
ncbi:MAG: hypothetical protein IKP79_03100, partial [Bacilli bacterium]|nr:hypothetical protein [Bacilli bacterium]